MKQMNSKNGTNAQDGNHVETNGVKIYYQMYGDGEPLLLLHGFLFSHQIWEPWIEDLSRNNQLIVPDLPGHGKSTNPTNEFRSELVAKDIFGLMDYLGIDHFKAIGHSVGAAILAYMATMNSFRISAMILVGSPSYLPDKMKSVAGNISFETIDDGLKSLLESLQPGGKEQIRRLLTQLRNIANSNERPNMNLTSADFSTIKCQSLIIDGDRDVFFPVGVPVSIYEAIPNSYLWIVPNSGHTPIGIFGEESIWHDVALKVFDEFLKGKWN